MKVRKSVGILARDPVAVVRIRSGIREVNQPVAVLSIRKPARLGRSREQVSEAGSSWTGSLGNQVSRTVADYSDQAETHSRIALLT